MKRRILAVIAILVLVLTATFFNQAKAATVQDRYRLVNIGGDWFCIITHVGTGYPCNP